MSAVLATLGGWVRTVVSFLSPHPAPVPVTDASRAALVAAAKSIILSQTRAYGPDPVTGGVTHVVDDATAQLLAELFVQYAPEYGLSVAFAMAGAAGESIFDPNALDPNANLSKPGETAEQAFLHSDIGLGQFDGATLVAMAEFKGADWESVRAKAYDPRWAVPAFCAFLRSMRVSANEVVYGVRTGPTTWEIEPEPSLLDNVPNHDIQVFACESYNRGLQGTMHVCHVLNTGTVAEKQAAAGAGPDVTDTATLAAMAFAYGIRWTQQRDAFAKILGTKE